jgi:tRNA (pseudouridine54-N1)-methyltransferase
VIRFVVIGQNADASGGYLIDDVPGTGGRIDVLLRCVRSALLISHGVRRDVMVYLVLGGSSRAPRVLRFEGAKAKFLRPDERSLAISAKKALRSETTGSGFVEVKPGIAVADGGLGILAAECQPMRPYRLDQGGRDLREVAGIEAPDAAFFVGDHLGFDAPTRVWLTDIGAQSVGLGPVSLQAEDAIAIAANEIDRRRVDIAR